MRFCEYCGSQRSEKAKYCPRCGKKVNESNAQTVIFPDTDSQFTENLQVTDSFTKGPQENIDDASNKGRKQRLQQKKIIGMLAAVAVAVAFAIMSTVGLPQSTTSQEKPNKHDDKNNQTQLMKIAVEKNMSRDNLDEKDGYLGIPWGTLPDAIAGIGKEVRNSGPATIYEMHSDTSALTGKTVPDKVTLSFYGKKRGGLYWATLQLSDGHSVRQFLEHKYGRPQTGLYNLGNYDVDVYVWTTGVSNGICLMIYPEQLKAKGSSDASLIVFNKTHRPAAVQHMKF